MTQRAVYAYTRAVTPAPDRRNAVLGRLRTLHDQGHVDAVRTWTWPSEVSRSAADAADAVDVFEQFERWADRNGVSVRPPFRWSSRASTITGDREEVLVTPDLCLAVRDGGALVGVFPCSDGRTTHGIDDALDALAEDTLPGGLGGTPPLPAHVRGEESDA